MMGRPSCCDGATRAPEAGASEHAGSAAAHRCQAAVGGGHHQRRTHVVVRLRQVHMVRSRPRAAVGLRIPLTYASLPMHI